MAKGQISEKELSEGLTSAGGLRGLVSATGSRRDSPFGAGQPSVMESKAPVAEESERVGEAAKIIPTVPSEQPRKQSSSTASPSEQRRQRERVKAEPISSTPDRKAMLFSEAVTLRMTPETRDRVNALATRLQRTRTEKLERMTANVVMRVAIEVFLETFDSDAAPVSNTEAELLEIARSRIRWS